MSEMAGLARFRPLAVALGSEEAMLDSAHGKLGELDAGTVAVLPEYLAWTAEGSARAYIELSSVAQAHGVTVITTLNLGPDLTEDLPGRDDDSAYNALVIFTRHGNVHVPQAKITPHAFEQSQALGGPNIGVGAYGRTNRVSFDVGDRLLDVRFFIGCDLWMLTRLAPSRLACDLIVVVGGFARGADMEAEAALLTALEASVARAGVLANAGQPDESGPAREVELVLAADRKAKPTARWRSPRKLAEHFRLVEDMEVDAGNPPTLASSRDGRIAVPRALAEASVAEGRYPVTVVV